MSIMNFKEARHHIGHDIVCVCYGKKGRVPQNVSIECETCNEVLIDWERGDNKDEEGLQNKQ